jgi:ABC-type arginine/histidine transport system permease subunit
MADIVLIPCKEPFQRDTLGHLFLKVSSVYLQSLVVAICTNYWNNKKSALCHTMYYVFRVTPLITQLFPSTILNDWYL